MTEETQDLEGQIQAKQNELDERVQMLARYEKNIGRDRWFNRGQHDVHTLRQELAALIAQRPAADT